MRIREIVTEEKLDEVSLKALVAAGVIGLSSVTPPHGQAQDTGVQQTQSYNVFEEAVRAALRACWEKSQNKHEFISVVYEVDGQYLFTEPSSTSTTGRSRTATAAVKIPEGSLRAIVHNHPKGKSNEIFSGKDVEQAEKLGVPSFIIFAPREGGPEMRVYRPGQTETQTRLPGQSSNYQGLLKTSNGDKF